MHALLKLTSRAQNEVDSNSITESLHPNCVIHTLFIGHLYVWFTPIISHVLLCRSAANRALIQYFAKLGQSKNTDEHLDLDFVEGLITQGADVNCTDEDGQTIMHEVRDSSFIIPLSDKGSEGGLR